MKCKDCKIVCDGKEIAAISCTEDGITIKCTDEGKKLCKDFCGTGCC
ncbi:MAG: hypothetical protein ABH834_00265 [Candidatus Altiarchaeota archaeon]